MPKTTELDFECSSNVAEGQTVQIGRLLDRLQTDDKNAIDELIRCSCDRLERLTRKMLRGWQRVHRWEETCDVLQNALLRLCHSLQTAKPARAIDFFRLAALNIRRELHDLARHYYGPCGEGANHATQVLRRPEEEGSDFASAQDYADEDEDPANLAAWAEFHEQVDRLPDEEREMFDLLWYQELSQGEAATLLGISERTVKRRWVAARLKLSQVFGNTLTDQEVPAAAR